MALKIHARDGAYLSSNNPIFLGDLIWSALSITFAAGFGLDSITSFAAIHHQSGYSISFAYLNLLDLICFFRRSASTRVCGRSWTTTATRANLTFLQSLAYAPIRYLIFFFEMKICLVLLWRSVARSSHQFCSSRSRIHSLKVPLFPCASSFP